MAEEKNDKTASTAEPVNHAFPNVVPGATIRVHQEISETDAKGEEKKRIQIFEGLVIKRKHGKDEKAMITVRKISGGVAVEKIFPLASATIKKIEVVKKFKVRRAKLGFLKGHQKRMKEIK